MVVAATARIINAEEKYMSVKMKECRDLLLNWNEMNVNLLEIDLSTEKASMVRSGQMKGRRPAS